MRVGDAGFEFCFYFGPLAVEDAEVDGVADAAGPGDEVFAESAFFFRAETKDGVAGFFVEGVGLQFDADTVPEFEGVTQHQKFCFGVDRGALPRGSNPGRTDFQAAVGAVDVHETRAANDAIGIVLDSGEDDGIAPVLFGEGLFDDLRKILGTAYLVRDPTEDVVERIFSYVPEINCVIAAQRFKANGGTLQRNWPGNIEMIGN